MYQFFVEPEQIDVAGKSVIIRGNDVNHIKNVLRMRPGEEVAVSNGIDGREYRLRDPGVGGRLCSSGTTFYQGRWCGASRKDLPVPGTA